MRHSLLGQAHEPTGRALLVPSDGTFLSLQLPANFSLAQLARALLQLVCCVVIDSAKAGSAAGKADPNTSLTIFFYLHSVSIPRPAYLCSFVSA